jgi:hypothetical protein
MTHASGLVALAALVSLAACSRSAAPAAPAPTPEPVSPAATPAVPASTPAIAPGAPAPAAAAAVDLAGEWTWGVDLGGQAVSGVMTLTRTGSVYGGQVTPDGEQPATVRTVTITGDRVTIIVDAPEGEAVVEATLAADHRSLAGTLNYQGMAGSFTARKR